MGPFSINQYISTATKILTYILLDFLKKTKNIRSRMHTGTHYYIERKLKFYEPIFNLKAPVFLVSCYDFCVMRKLFTLLLVLFAWPALSQTYYFKNYEISDGLPSNCVICLIQDGRGFMWVGTKDGVCRFDGNTFMTYGDTPSQSLMNGVTNSLCEDLFGMIWFATTNGVGYYNPDTDAVTEVERNPKSVQTLLLDSEGCIWAFSADKIVRYDNEYDDRVFRTDFSPYKGCVDSYGEVWFTSNDSRIHHFNYSTGDFDSIEIPEPALRGEKLQSIANARNRKLIISTDKGRIYRYDILTRKAEVLNAPQVEGAVVNCITARSENEYWIACITGVYRYMEGEGIVNLITNDSPHSIQDSNVMSMFEDSDGNIWLGTFHNGLGLWANRTHSISQFLPSDKDNDIKGNLVKAIEGDSRGNIWVGTEDGFLNVFLIAEEKLKTLDRSSGLPEGLNYHAMLNDGNRMWMVTFNGGIYVLDSRQFTVTRHYSPEAGNLGCICRKKDGTIVVGGVHGLFFHNKQTDSFEPVKGFENDWVHSVFEDSQGTLWVGTYGNGLVRVQGNTINRTMADTPNIGLPSNYIVGISEDSNRNLWLATEGGGLCCTSIEGKPQFRCFARKEGLPSNVACAIAEDNKGNLWVSTTRGLVEFDPVSMSILNTYLDTNDTVGDNFSFGSCYVSPSGAFHFGTNKGLLKFDPEKLSEKDKDKPLYIVDIHTGEEDRVIELRSEGRSALTSDKIKLKSRDAAFLSISFVSPVFSDINKMQYEYTFHSRRGDIHSVLTDNTVVFTDIMPGKYEFNVKVAGSTSPESSKSLTFDVQPPFYASAFAIVLYSFIFLALVMAFMWQIRHKRRQDKVHEMEKMEASKQQEIAEAKINFFTNITHEIRTPLTLIKLPIDKIISSKEYTEESKEDIFTIQANTTRLLNLTNQLLDIKKMEKKNFTLNLSEFDICEFTERMWGYFAAGIKERHLENRTDIPAKEIKVCSDSDFLEKIICNMLSNAVKYSESALSLKLVQDNDMMRIIMDSDGDRIPMSEAEKIFEPFYQVRTVNSQLKGSNGTGLGLPYARNLAQALGGSLYLDTNRNDCNSFVFEFPVRSNSDAFVEDEEAVDTRNFYVDGNRHWILVVEDNESMNKYLCQQLEKTYNMLSAGNGEEALELIRNNKVDLVISDIMMPVMDGCELCNRIKRDEEFSHIPVILFTAAVGVETRIQTLEVGADGYIEKPFSIELLRANIDNLFKNREIAYNQFANSPLTHFKSMVVNNIDQDFMDRLHAAVMDNIANQDLGIDTLTTLMFTSKSTLYRKVKANTGVNINEYIRISRLKKAAEMLATQKYRINEVAYLTGFSSPSYFATSFQKQFKESPSNFVKNLSKK